MIKRQGQFDDPATDTLLNIVLSLGGEVYALRDRMRIIEKMLEAKGAISRADIDAYSPTSEEEEEIRKDRDAFMSRFFHTFERDPD
jgi:hypothetical protein